LGGPLPLAVAFLAVLALIGFARLLCFADRTSLSGAGEAHGLAQSIPGGFIPIQTTEATDGAGALLRDATGRIAVVAPIGAHFFVRLNEGDWIVEESPAGQLSIFGKDFACQMALGSAAQQWLEAINGGGGAAR
jgi:hypothetical protein